MEDIYRDFFYTYFDDNVLEQFKNNNIFLAKEVGTRKTILDSDHTNMVSIFIGKELTALVYDNNKSTKLSEAETERMNILYDRDPLYSGSLIDLVLDKESVLNKISPEEDPDKDIFEYDSFPDIRYIPYKPARRHWSSDDEREKYLVVDRSNMNNETLCLECNSFDFPNRIDKNHTSVEWNYEVYVGEKVLTGDKVKVLFNGRDISSKVTECYSGDNGWVVRYPDTMANCAKCLCMLRKYLDFGKVEVAIK